MGVLVLYGITITHIGSYRAIRTSNIWSYRYTLKLVASTGLEPVTSMTLPHKDVCEQTGMSIHALYQLSYEAIWCEWMDSNHHVFRA